MRHESCDVADVEEYCGHGVRHVVAVHFQDFEPVPQLSHNLELLFEVRAVVHNDLDENGVAVNGQVAGLLGVLKLLPVSAGAEVLGLVGDDAHGAVAGVRREFKGFLVHLDMGSPEFEGAAHPGRETDNQDAQDEEGRNLQAVGALDRVDHGGVDEHEGDQSESNDLRPLLLSPRGQGHGY
ncbi:hypothetical protein D3C73_1236550 [compost metagenome]